MSAQPCDLCGNRLRKDNQLGVCNSKARPVCRRENDRRRAARDREHFREYQRQWRLANPGKQEVYGARAREYHRRYYQEHQEEMKRRGRANYRGGGYLHAVLSAAKARARKKGVPFSLTRADLPPQPEMCPILGIRLEISDGVASPHSPSLDRISPQLGYVPGNVHWISHRANSIKNDATPDELIAIAEYLKSLTGTDGEGRC